MNGWTNRNTWLVIMHLESNPGTYHFWQERAEELDEYDLAEELEQDITRSIDHRIRGLGSPREGGLLDDLVGRNPSFQDANEAVDSINFQEIAEAWKDECEG